ncbi:MAG: hypothetical protein HY907_22780 [Deltaproteobacteria bacterium]|nr:hypothetical protein [Deltaproteobacteria bacterium]
MGGPTPDSVAAASAVRFVFPDLDALVEFQRSDPEVARVAVPRLVQFAHEQGLIPLGTEVELRAWLERAPVPANRRPPGLSFGELMDRVAERRPVKRLIDAELRPLCRQLGLPDVQASMVSRLRDRFAPNTRGKRNLLRVLAFWIGLHRPAWGWDYPALLQLGVAAEPSPDLDSADGVRLAFRIALRDGLSEAEGLEWLREELAASCRGLGLFHLGPERIAVAAGTLYVSVPRSRRNPEDALLYSRALRDAVALAHQALVRWSLRDFGVGQALTVAIAAGPFAGLDTSLQAMLKARVPEGAPIRVTSFVHSCAGLAEIKLVFRPEPYEVVLYASETLEVWVADSLWSHVYYDVVAAAEGLIPSTREALPAFRDSLFAGDGSANRALAVALAQPDNTMLHFELAKACLARGLFREADRFVAVILAHRPFHVVARTLRLVVHLNLALSQTEPAVTWSLLRDAIDQGRFILDHCRVENEEPYCELGQVHFCVARRLYHTLVRRQAGELALAHREISGSRSGRDEPEPRALEDSIRGLVLDHLRQAADCFDRGRTISPSGMGHRSLHWTFRVRALEALLRSDDEAFAPERWPDGMVQDRHDVFRTTANRLLVGLGWSADNPPGRGGTAASADVSWPVHILRAFDRYDNAVLSAPYRANVRYAFAALVFDFAPELTVGMLRLVLAWLGEAETQAGAIAARPEGAHSIITCFSQIQPASRLVERAAAARRRLLALYGADLESGDESRVLGGREHKFLLAGFTRPVDFSLEELC